jgi:LAO/AO transport system kinase
MPAIARGLTLVEEATGDGDALIEALYPLSGRAHVVGITGAPGAGKSTLTSSLIKVIRADGPSVGVIAVDPSSPYSGGSILGDRIRMGDVIHDPGVFIRSMSTRGALGGLCAAARSGVDLLDAAGKDVVIVETVGVGQDEVDIMRLAHTIVVVSVPGLGDDIQAMKAGILEIADVHVVNKADREGAHRAVAELRSMLAQRPLTEDGWPVPVLPVVATSGQGVEDLANQLRAHTVHSRRTGEWQRRERRMAESRILKLAEHMLAETLTRPLDGDTQRMVEAIDHVASRTASPRRCARELLTVAMNQRGRPCSIPQS